MTQENSTQKPSANAGKTDADTGPSLGVYLQRERQKKQLSIEKVAEITRIPPEKLVALEAGNKNLLPVAVFTRGFVKIYAAHLGLNQADVLERFSNEWGAVESVTPEILSRERMAESSPFFFSFRFYILILLTALIIALAYFFFQADNTPLPVALTTVPLSMEQPGEQLIIKATEIKQIQIASTAPAQGTLLISPQSAGKIVLEEEDSPQDALHGQEMPESADASPKTSSPHVALQSLQPPTTTSQTPESQEPRQSLSQSVHLHIRFIKKTHISVAQDDDQPEKFIFAQGEESTWQAANHITLHVDDADAVELSLNGSPVTVDHANNGPLAITLPTDLDH